MNLKFKTIVLFSVSFLYLISTLAIFFIFNDFYVKTTLKKFIDENQYSANVVYDFIEQEKQKLITSSRIAGSDDIIMHAFRNKVFVKSDAWIIEGNTLKSNISKMDKMKYIQLANFSKEKLFGGGRGGEQKSISLYDDELRLVGFSADSPREFLDKGDENYIQSCKGGVNLGGVEISLIQKKDNKFFMKGLAPLGKRWRASDSSSFGLIVVGERLDGELFDSIKKIVNKEIILFSESKVITSTIFKNSARLEESVLKINTGKVVELEGKKYFFTETLIDNKKMGITYFNIHDFNGKEIASIGVGFSYLSVDEMYKKNLWKFIGFSVIFTLILFVLLYFIMIKLFAPFNKIQEGLKDIKEGKYDTKIEVRGGGELSLLADSLNNLTRAVESRESRLKDVTESVRNLLNNAGQGFLSFGIDMIIGNEYSKECEKIFGFDLRGKKITVLLFGEDTKQIKFVESILQKILKEREKAQLYYPLVPDRVTLNDRTLSIEFKTLQDKEEFMLVITDITEKILLENQMEKERNILKMAVNAATQKSILFEIMNEYTNFYTKEIREILDTHSSLENISFEIFRRVHTLKGNVNQINLISLTKKLHEFENKISEIRRDIKTITKEEFEKAIYEENMGDWINEDKKLLKDILGEDFFDNKEEVTLDRKELIELEKKARRGGEILTDIRQLSNKTLKELLEPYIKYTKDMAARLGKAVRINGISGEDISVDEKYHDFLKALVHIFRNSVDHGIEEIEEREMLGKESAGTILCKIDKDKENFKITIEDDGNGIDVERIAAKAIEKGIISEAEKRNSLREDLLQLIFYDEMTTKDEVTHLSGRGEGLSAVKVEVEKLGGTIEVVSEKGKGTKFVFTIPYKDLKDAAKISGKEIIKVLMKTASKFFSEEGKIETLVLNSEVKKLNQIELYRVTSFVSITGVISAEVMVSVEEGVAERLVDTLIVSQIDKADRSNYIDSVLEESTNVIIGNSLEAFKEVSEYMTVSYPSTVFSDKTVMKYPGKEIWSYMMNTDYGRISISLVIERE